MQELNFNSNINSRCIVLRFVDFYFLNNYRIEGCFTWKYESGWNEISLVIIFQELNINFRNVYIIFFTFFLFIFYFYYVFIEFSLFFWLHVYVYLDIFIISFYFGILFALVFFFGFFLFPPLSVHFLLDVLYLLFYTLSLFTRSSSLFLSIIFFVLFYSTSTSPFTIFLHFFFLRNFCFFLPIHLLVISLFAPLFTRFFSVSRFECWSNQHWATLELIKVKK